MNTNNNEARNLVATRQVVITHYLGPSNVKGARVCARTSSGAQTAQVVVGYEHALSSDKNHAAARRALAAELRWDWPDVSWVQARLSDAEYVHIPLDHREVDHLFVESAEAEHLLPALMRKQAE